MHVRTHNSLELVSMNILSFQFLIPTILAKNFRALLLFHNIPFLTVSPGVALLKSTTSVPTSPPPVSIVTREDNLNVSGPESILVPSLVTQLLPLRFPLSSGTISNPFTAESSIITGFWLMICEKGLGAGLTPGSSLLRRNPSLSSPPETATG